MSTTRQKQKQEGALHFPRPFGRTSHFDRGSHATMQKLSCIACRIRVRHARPFFWRRKSPPWKRGAFGGKASKKPFPALKILHTLVSSVDVSTSKGEAAALRLIWKLWHPTL